MEVKVLERIKNYFLKNSLRTQRKIRDLGGEQQEMVQVRRYLRLD